MPVHLLCCALSLQICKAWLFMSAAGDCSVIFSCLLQNVYQ